MGSMPARWFQPPRFEDDDRTRAAAVLHWILLATGAAVLFGIVASPVAYPRPLEAVPLYGLVLLAVAGALSAIRRGHVRKAAATFVTVAWCVTMAGAFRFGGPQAPAATALPVLVLLTGFVVSARAALAMALLSAAVILGMTLSQSPGPPTELGPMRYWLAVTICVLMSAALVNLALRSIHAALQESRVMKRGYEQMVAASPYGMVAVNAAGQVESVNPAAERIGLRPAKEMVGRRFLELGLLPQEELDWAMETTPRAFAGKFEGPVEIEVARADGSRVPIEVRVRRMVQEDGSVGLQATLRDLSERHEAARDLQDMEARLLQSQKLEGLGRLAGGIAHDFNNHLTAIRITTELLAGHVADRPEATDLLAGIEAAAERSSNLIRQLLAFSRKQILQPRVLDPNELISELDPMLRRILPENVALQTFCTGGLGSVRADPAQIETALLNLVVNARDALPDGGTITIETRSTWLEGESADRYGEVEPGPYVLIVVSDDGEGMDEAGKSRIFEPFFSTKGERGSGLGLATVYGIVSQSGGTISVKSEPGRGSSFEIQLPKVEGDAEGDAESELEPLPARAGGTILVVEDNELIRVLCLSVLRSRGYEVLVAENGVEALEILEKETTVPDLVVADVVMPKLGGLGLARAVRKRYPTLPILFMSGYSGSADMADALEELGAEILPKPFSASALARCVHRILGRS